MAMTTEETSDGLVSVLSEAAASTQRQRFYIELKPGETTIVSWKKLLREGKTIDRRPCKTTKSVMESSQSGTHRSSAHESTKRPLDGNSEVSLCSGPLIRREKLENQFTSSGYQHSRKRIVERTKMEGKKNDDPSSKHVRLEEKSQRDSSKTAALLNKPFCQYETPPMVKDHHLNWPQQSSEVDARLLIYKKRSATFSSKSNCPLPVSATRNASKFPSKTKQSALRKTEKFSSGMSRIKGGDSGDLSDVMRQNSARKCFLLRTNSRCSTLTDERKLDTSYKNQRSDKSGGSRELVDAVSPGYSSPHSKSGVNDTKPDKSFSKDLKRGIEEETVAGSKSFKVSPMMKEHIRMKRKVTYLMSSPPDKEPARKATADHPIPIPDKQFPEKKHVKIRFSMKSQHEIHMYQKRAAIDKMNCSTL